MLTMPTFLLQRSPLYGCVSIMYTICWALRDLAWRLRPYLTQLRFSSPSFYPMSPITIKSPTTIYSFHRTSCIHHDNLYTASATCTDMETTTYVHQLSKCMSNQ